MFRIITSLIITVRRHNMLFSKHGCCFDNIRKCMMKYKIITRSNNTNFFYSNFCICCRRNTWQQYLFISIEHSYLPYTKKSDATNSVEFVFVTYFFIISYIFSQKRSVLNSIIIHINKTLS